MPIGVQCVCKAAWVWFGDTIGLTQPYQVWAGHSLSQKNKEALRTKVGYGMWGQAPGGASHPEGRAGLKELPPGNPDMLHTLACPMGKGLLVPGQESCLFWLGLLRGHF